MKESIKEQLRKYVLEVSAHPDKELFFVDLISDRILQLLADKLEAHQTNAQWVIERDEPRGYDKLVVKWDDIKEALK